MKLLILQGAEMFFNLTDHIFKMWVNSLPAPTIKTALQYSWQVSGKREEQTAIRETMKIPDR